jgi:UDP-N-acetyl-2-amino-2-deoxyglucuronate dehydrogenase
MLGCAIVGCGMIARFHARALAEVPGTKVVALVGRSLANADHMRQELGLTCDIAANLA